MTATRDAQSFGEVLRRYRRAAGLSQEALAERAGISLRGVSDLERGLSRAPRLQTLGRLSDAMSLEGPARQALATAAGYPPVTEPLDSPPGMVAATARRAAPQALPGYLTGLLGRVHDAAAIEAQLRHADVRLVSLTGPGGVGKTRLAVQVASNVEDLFPDGVIFVPLAPLRDAALVPSAIAHAAGVGDTADVPLLDALALALRGQQVLLVLDNYEHLLDAAPLVADLLVRCPRMSILSTSRTRLRVHGEHNYPVRPLVVPTTAETPTPEDAETWPAVALFVQRAQAADPSFSLSPANADAVVAICQRVDGLPLALELAAARVAVLPPAAILERLHQRMPVLTSGLRDAPERHRALRDTIAWSYDLLNPDEQRLFRRLSVFAAGWSLAAAEDVCTEPGATQSVLDGLGMLVEHSLLQPTADATGEPRFTQLETIRMHALDQLEASGEINSARQRHAGAFLRLAEEIEPHLVSADRVPWLRRTDLELGNIRAALHWSSGPDGDAELGQQLIGSLSWFWYLRGHLQEGRMWAQRLLAKSGSPTPTPGRARALFAFGGIVLMLQGDAVTARVSLTDSADLFRAQDDWHRLAHCLIMLGLATTSCGEPAAALRLYAESVALARTLADPWLEAFALANQGAATELLDNSETAESLYRASLSLFSGLNDAWGQGLAQRGLGTLAAARGDAIAARAACAESVSLFRASGDARGLAQALLGLARAELRAGSAREAESMFAEALVRWQKLGIGVGIVRSIAGLGHVAAIEGRPEDAVRLYASATTAARRAGVGHAQEQAIANLRDELEPARFAAAWAAGEHMSVDDTITHAAAPTASDS